MPRLLLALTLGFLVGLSTPVAAQPGSGAVGPTESVDSDAVRLPDVALVDHEGKPVRFATDVIGDRLVAVNFIFTRCDTICAPMAANFAQLGPLLPPDARLVSVSIDPVTDTPERLAGWAKQFGNTSDWRLLTGEKQVIDGLLVDLGVFSAVVEEHAPVVLLGNAATGTWKRGNGLASAATLADTLRALQSDAPVGAAAAYFPDVALTDQHGERHRFYSDLMKGHTVVINAFFSTCEGSCPVTTANLQAIQSAVGDRLGKDVRILSISLDPKTDTPERLARYAESVGAKPGWSFLTGSRDEVRAVLSKLGLWVEEKESHSAIVLIGNDRTGLWKKGMAVGDAAELTRIVASVADDKGGP